MRKSVTDEFRKCVAQALEELKDNKRGGSLWAAVLVRANELYKEKPSKL